MMSRRANHEWDRRSANSLTLVGLRRASIGPPIMIIVFGTAGSLDAARRDTAASTGTVGWHTDMTLRSGDNARMNSCT